jgi:hypothetical protein
MKNPTRIWWANKISRMDNEQRKLVATEYLKALDNGGVTSSGGSIFDLFAPGAQV